MSIWHDPGSLHPHAVGARPPAGVWPVGGGHGFLRRLQPFVIVALEDRCTMAGRTDRPMGERVRADWRMAAGVRLRLKRSIRLAARDSVVTQIWRSMSRFRLSLA
jgi:hypothetical protein